MAHLTLSMTELILPCIHNTVDVCKQLTHLILEYGSSKLVGLVKFISVSIRIPNNFVYIICFEVIIFTSEIFFLFSLKFLMDLIKKMKNKISSLV